MSSKNYELYRKHQIEIFDMIYNTIKKAPALPSLDFFFGTESKEEREEFNKKMDEYLKIEEPKIKERLKEMGFGSK